MTLARFKKRLKYLAILTSLVVYGSLSYLAGRNTIKIDLPQVKGASTENEIPAPVTTPMPGSDTQSVNITAASVKLCANTVYSFQVSYPSNWFTTYNDDRQKCTFFAPYSFVLPYDVTNFTLPIKIEVVSPTEWQSTVTYYQNPNDYQNIISSQNVNLIGKSITKIQAQTTGKDQNSKGFAKMSYLIFDSEKPLVMTYQQTDAKEDVQKAQMILEDMVKSLQYY